MLQPDDHISTHWSSFDLISSLLKHKNICSENLHEPTLTDSQLLNTIKYDNNKREYEAVLEHLMLLPDRIFLSYFLARLIRYFFTLLRKRIINDKFSNALVIHTFQIIAITNANISREI